MNSDNFWADEWTPINEETISEIDMEKLREALAELNHEDCMDECKLNITNNVFNLIVPEKYILEMDNSPWKQIWAIKIDGNGKKLDGRKLIARLDQLK